MRLASLVRAAEALETDAGESLECVEPGCSGSILAAAFRPRVHKNYVQSSSDRWNTTRTLGDDRRSP